MAGLQAAGLYQPDDPDAEQRLALLRFLTESGCTVEEMVAAHRRGRLFALAGDRIVRPGRDALSLGELAERVGVDADSVAAVWRALGLVVAEGPVASEADVAAVAAVIEISAVVGFDAALGVARVISAGLARISDAVSTAVRMRVPDMAVSTSGDELATARTFARLAGFVPRLGSVLDAVLRHHIEAARMHFESTASWDVVGDGGIRVSVGFADLSGFTALSAQLSLDELSSLLTKFETVAADIVAREGARLVKFIGDAVMWVAATPATAAKVATSLLAEGHRHGVVARAGVTTGTVLALDGDYFGPVVNLAARLVAMAAPDEVLVDQPTGAALGTHDGERGSEGPSYDVEELGSRPVRGFPEPVPVARLR